MSTVNSVVAVYNTHGQAAAAIEELQEAGVDMQTLSITAKDTYTDEHLAGYCNAGDRMEYWAKVGALGAASGAYAVSDFPAILDTGRVVRCAAVTV